MSVIGSTIFLLPLSSHVLSFQLCLEQQVTPLYGVCLFAIIPFFFTTEERTLCSSETHLAVVLLIYFGFIFIVSQVYYLHYMPGIFKTYSRLYICPSPEFLKLFVPSPPIQANSEDPILNLKLPPTRTFPSPHERVILLHFGKHCPSPKFLKVCVVAPMGITNL